MNDVVPFRQQALAYTGKQLDLIRRTVAADCNPTEFDLYLEVARRVGLDPFRKQIYAVVYNKDKPEKRRMSIITGIDGLRAVAARNRDYRPDENAPEFAYDLSLKGDTNPLGLVSVIVRCSKLSPDGQWHPVAGIAFWDEFCPMTEKWAFDPAENKRAPSGVFELDKKSKWYTMPRVMLAKCAEAVALRKGWPEDLSGIYGEEELDRARTMDMTASEALEVFEADKRAALVGGRDSILVQWQPDSPLEPISAGQFADKVAAHVRTIATLPDLDGWAETNRAALQQFWALNKSDGLELKKLIEARKAEIAQANMVA